MSSQPALAAAGPFRPVTIGEYVLGPVLGQGSTCVVYQATRGHETFAIKVRADGPVVESHNIQLQFRREAAAIARFDHPSLVRVVEVGESNGRPYLVMDLIEGESLDKRIARSPLGEEETLAWSKSVTAALAEVHRFGLVHRDVKPANIVLGSNGTVKLIDFGLVTGATSAEAVVGTLQYAAPEQVGVLKRAVGAPADLYSLGATMFECLTGRPPIEADFDTDFLSLLASVPAPNLLALRPEASPVLGAILAKLLSKDPDDRYQNARGLLADLDALSQLEASVRAGAALQLGTGDAPKSNDQEVPLVGRAEELARLERAFDQALGGTTTFAQVEGECGSGKTRLIHEMELVAQRRGALVLSGKCQQLDTAPFGPLREAADQYVSDIFRLPEAERHLAVQRIRSAAGSYAPVIRRLSRGLAQLLGEVTELRALDPDAEQQRYYEAIAGFFRNLASADKPLVLVVEDVQWLDESSLRVLGRLAAAGAGAPLCVLTTARDNAASQEACTRFVETAGARLCERIALPPLGLKAVGQLIASRLGDKPLDPPLVQKLAVLTRGNPFAVGEYLRALLDGGLIRPVGGGWVGDSVALDAVSLPRDVVDLMVGRLSAMRSGSAEDARTARLVGVAAVIGRRFSIDLLVRVGGVTSEAVLRAIEAMLRAGLVERTSIQFCDFLHDSIREAAAANLLESERQDIHQAIAETLDATATSSPDHLYSLARHYGQGHTARSSRRACETNFAAGVHSLEEHANEAAFELLDRALGMARSAGLYDSLAMQLHEGLGRACAMTGRLALAFQHLEEALQRARDRQDRFRLQYLLTLTYASQGRNDDALTSLWESFRVLGRPFPRSALVQTIVTLWSWVVALALHWTGIGYGSAAGEERKRRRVLSQLHYAGSMIALFQGRPFLMVQFIVRDFLNVHFLGATPETAIAYSVYGAVLGTFQLTSVMRKYTKLGLALAEQIGDQAAVAVCRAYQAMGLKWSGDLVAGNRLLVDEALPELHRHVPGSWYQAMMICEQSYSYVHAGLSAEAIDHIRNNLSQLERTNNLMFRYNTMSVLYAQLMVTGQVTEAAELWARLEQQFQPLAKTIYVGLARCIARLEVLVDEDEIGPPVNLEIAAFQQLLSEDYYSCAARVLAGYARLAQFLQSEGELRTGARRRLEQTIFGLSLRAMAPVFQCHPLILRAALARVDGKFEHARRLLARADVLVTRCQSSRGAFYAALEHARLARQMGEPTFLFYATTALEIALSRRWRQKAARVRTEFQFQEDRQDSSSSPTFTATSTLATSLDQSRRYADALLQVSLASASTLDPEVQAQNALVEVARVFGAERALFFLLEPSSGALILKATTGAGAEKASQTVVRKVAETRAPLVVTGNSDGEALGSESIVTYGLRSIMAAPLMLRDRLLGVVYLDSRLAKGMFTQDDVALLLGLSNHIAIAVETARTARLESERTAMARDLEVLGAVQNLLLPKVQTFSSDDLCGAGFYQPATQCGGDWWWHEVRPDGSVIILLGDVSGHGAGPAMISSAVAGSFHTIRSLQTRAHPVDILMELDRCVRDFGGDFHMTMSVICIDPNQRTLSWWNAAGPEVFILRNGKIQCVTAPGSMLGDVGPLDVGEATVPFGPGDRLLLCTDGLLELKGSDGRPLGSRRISRLFSQVSSFSLTDSRIQMGQELNAFLGGRPQDDDITFVMVEARPESDDSGKSLRPVALPKELR